MLRTPCLKEFLGSSSRRARAPLHPIVRPATKALTADQNHSGKFTTYPNPKVTSSPSRFFSTESSMMDSFCVYRHCTIIYIILVPQLITTFIGWTGTSFGPPAARRDGSGKPIYYICLNGSITGHVRARGRKLQNESLQCVGAFNVCARLKDWLYCSV